MGRFEFVEWTLDKHLRHSRFVAEHAPLYCATSVPLDS